MIPMYIAEIAANPTGYIPGDLWPHCAPKQRLWVLLIYVNFQVPGDFLKDPEKQDPNIRDQGSPSRLSGRILGCARSIPMCR